MSEPFPVHDTAIYSMENKAYTVNLEDRFQVEQIVLSPGWFHTEWLIGGGWRNNA